MGFLLTAIIFVSFFGIFTLYNSYVFQIFLKGRKSRRIFLDDFEIRVKGVYFPQGFFNSSNKVILPREHKRLAPSQKGNFLHCYNFVKFKSQDCEWEIFFYLVKEGLVSKEYMNVRGFPRETKIHSEANIENNKGRVNTLANNRYLAHILEEASSQKTLRFILDTDGDVLQFYHNNFHFNICLRGRLMDYEKVVEIVKALGSLKNKVYKKGIIGY